MQPPSPGPVPLGDETTPLRLLQGVQGPRTEMLMVVTMTDNEYPIATTQNTGPRPSTLAKGAQNRRDAQRFPEKFQIIGSTHENAWRWL